MVRPPGKYENSTRNYNRIDLSFLRRNMGFFTKKVINEQIEPFWKQPPE